MGWFLLTSCLFATSISASASLPGRWGQTQDQASTLTRFTFTEYHMGVDARLVVYAKDKAMAESACSAAFERIAQLDSILSDYRVDSEAMLLCAKAGGPPVKVSPDLFKVLQVSEEISRRSNGEFDVTIGPLVRLWRKARKTHELPPQAEIEAARKLVGYHNVILDAKNQTVQLKVKGMKLDFGAIGKGYADDEAQAVFKKFGITRALVEMGGDIVVTNSPPGAKGWSIEVPNAMRTGEEEKGGKAPTMTIVNCAISTSGDTEEFAVIGGRRYSHVIDPHTGQALTEGVQATVIAKNGTISDPISTALTLLNEKQRARFLKDYPGTKPYVRILKTDVD
jgi:thiamine biosynthesis lipoprotein